MKNIRWTGPQLKAFVERWLRFRAEFGLTQTVLAEELGISVRQVKRIEGRENVPHDSTVCRFAEVEKKYRDGAERKRDLAWPPALQGEL